MKILVTGGAGFIGSNFVLDWIATEQLQALAQPLTKNGYGQYLLRILKENVF